jgi:hypothetical protein
MKIDYGKTHGPVINFDWPHSYLEWVKTLGSTKLAQDAMTAPFAVFVAFVGTDLAIQCMSPGAEKANVNVVVNPAQHVIGFDVNGPPALKENVRRWKQYGQDKDQVSKELREAILDDAQQYRSQVYGHGPLDPIAESAAEEPRDPRQPEGMTPAETKEWKTERAHIDALLEKDRLRVEAAQGRWVAAQAYAKTPEGRQELGQQASEFGGLQAVGNVRHHEYKKRGTNKERVAAAEAKLAPMREQMIERRTERKMPSGERPGRVRAKEKALLTRKFMPKGGVWYEGERDPKLVAAEKAEETLAMMERVNKADSLDTGPRLPAHTMAGLQAVADVRTYEYHKRGDDMPGIVRPVKPATAADAAEAAAGLRGILDVPLKRQGAQWKPHPDDRPPDPFYELAAHGAGSSLYTPRAPDTKYSKSIGGYKKKTRRKRKLSKKRKYKRTKQIRRY